MPAKLDHGDIEGVMALMPTPATPNGNDPAAAMTVDLEEAARAASALVEDGVDAVMINGTFGEAATLTRDEWNQFTHRVIESVDGRVPVLAGPTTLNTRTTIDRAKYADDIGADGLLLGRPMWCELSPEATVEYYRHVANAVPDLGIVVYENPTHFKGAIPETAWREIADIPQCLAAKFAGGFRNPADLIPELGESLQLMPGDRNWLDLYTEFPGAADACWSPSAPCDPRPVTALRDALFAGDDDEAERIKDLMESSYELWWADDLKEQARIRSRHNIAYEKVRIDAAGYMRAGPVRPPYHVTPEPVVDRSRASGERWAEIAEQLRSD